MLDNRKHTNSVASSSVPDDAPNLSRRGFLEMSAAAAFLFGFSVPLRATRAAADAATFAPNAFIRIDRQGEVTLIMPQVEMGQGTYTSISMILAEELDADWSRVRVEHAPADEKLYANPDLSIQATGNSNSIRAFWKPLRQAGAATRACFIEAAARSWGISSAECRTESGKVIHERTGRTLDYGALVGRAAAITPPKDPPLKDASAFRLIGRVAEAPRHSGQGQRQGQVRHRRPAAGSEVRDPRGEPRARRYGRSRRRSASPRRSRCAPDRGVG